MLTRGYTTTTPAYDAAVGRPFFRRVVLRFAQLVRRHQMQFRSAGDIGCGTGLFARHLRTVWQVPVFAVDASAAMLDAARQHCAGLREVEFIRQDIRRLALPCRVELITAHFDTLNHLIGPGDLTAAMRSVAANLTPGGWFYFDLVTPCAPLGGYDAVQRRMLVKRRGAPTKYFEQRAVWDPRSRLIAVRARVATRGACNISLAEDRHVERAYGAAELGRAVAAAGLIVRGVYDEAGLRHAGRCPPRLVVVAQRPG